MIAITGATGNTGAAAAQALLSKGERVRAIGRDRSKLETLTARAAEPFIGGVDDVEAMKAAFAGASAVYLLIPPAMQVADFRAYQDRVTKAYAEAIRSSGVGYVVTLSSLGAQHAEKTGPIAGLHNLEQTLNAIPGLNVLHLRAASFMENFLRAIEPLRSMGVLPGAAPPDHPAPLIAARDIGVYAAGRLAARSFSGSTVQELLGPRDYTVQEAAKIIGSAIGKPSLGYMQVPLPMIEAALVQMGFSKASAGLMVEMFKAENSGMCDPQQPRSPANTTTTSLESFAAEVFAPTYQGNAASA